LAIQLAALVFHSTRYGRKKVDYCLLTDLVKEYRHEMANFVHHTSGLEGFGRVPYLEGPGMCESLRYPEGSPKYEKDTELESEWSQLQGHPFHSCLPSEEDTERELTHEVQMQLAKMYLVDAEEYIQNAEDPKIQAICSRLTTRGQQQHLDTDDNDDDDGDGEAAAEAEEAEADKENDNSEAAADDGDDTGDPVVEETVSTLINLLFENGIDTESRDSFSAFRDAGDAGARASVDRDTVAGEQGEDKSEDEDEDRDRGQDEDKDEGGERARTLRRVWMSR
jgi:hypothetical protein